MSSAYDELRSIRERAVLKALASGPSTIKALSENLGYNYYTLRRDIKELETRSQVYKTGLTHGGQVEYAVGQARPIPYLRNRYSNIDIHPVDLVEYMAKDNAFESIDSIKRFPRILMELLHVAYLTSQGEPVNKKELTRLKALLQNDIALINSTVGLMQQVLSNEQFWTEEGITAMPADGKFPDFKTLSIWLRYYNE